MKIFVVLIIVFGFVGVGIWWFTRDVEVVPDDPEGNLAGVVETYSDGVIQFMRPEDFGLAVTEEQLSGMAPAYIPACETGFQYCFYYNGTEFEGTNFESAGIGIWKRTDLTSEDACLHTSPRGYANLGPSTASSTNYAASIFSPIGDAGAGHYSNGEIYRLFVRDPATCYEIETRIGETQFANYPVGTIRQFVEGDRDKVYADFREMLGSLTLERTGEKVRLPDSEN